MSFPYLRRSTRGWLLAVLGLTACDPKAVTDPFVDDDMVELRVQADVATAAVQVLVVEVTAPDIAEPFVFNIPVQNGTGAGTIRVSAGADRTFLVRAFDHGGVETHRGSETVDVMAGMNPTLRITLFPLQGEVPIHLTIGSLAVIVLPAVSELSVGEQVQLVARVTDAQGNPINLESLGFSVEWGSTNPVLASVDNNGLVAARAGGTVEVVANVGPARGAATVRVDAFGFDELLKFMSQNTPPSDRLEIKRTLPGKAEPEVVMTARFVAIGKLVETEVSEATTQEAGEGPLDPDEVPPDIARPGDQMLRVFHTGTQFEFEVAASADLLRTIHGIREAARQTIATEAVKDPIAIEGQDPDNGNMLQARSNGLDSRIIRTPTTAWPWRTISHFSNGCTGTLIGPRHIITAAHCVNQAGTSNWYSFTVRPGRDGDGATKEPFGNSTMSPTPAPGDPFRWYFTPSAWRNPSTANRGQWDWALIVIPDRLGDRTGWMGYVARPGFILGAQTHYNRGYPGCGGSRPDVPVNCQPRRLYGDLARCRLGPFSFPGPDGWNRLIDHSCDTSGGHSGSPVYHYFFDALAGGWVPVVSMVHRASRCDFITSAGVTIFCTLFDFTPSISRRITPSARWIISFFRAWRP